MLQDSRVAPLDRWRCSSWAQEWILRHIDDLEIYAHAANKTGKTTVGGVVDVRYCQGIPWLQARDGSKIELIMPPPPVHWGLGVQTYKIGAGTVFPVIRAALAGWDFVEEKAGGPDAVSVFHIRHQAVAKDNVAAWSKLFVYPYDGPTPEGPRLDGWHCDEPPPPRFLSAFRTRGKSGRRLRGLITATPIEKSKWYPVRSDYPDELMVADANRRARIQWSIYDNDALSAEDIAQAERSVGWGTDRQKPDARARLFGDHLNLEGDNPWPWELLDRWMARCREPRIQRLELQREVDTAEGRRLAPIAVDLEVLHEYDPGDVYVIWGDVGKGIADGRHDPDCLHVYARRKRALAARVNGYIGGYGLAQALAQVGAMYGKARVVPLVTGGYGEVVLSGLRQLGYGNIGHTRSDRAPGKWDVRLGATETAATRAMAIEAVEHALQTDSLLVESQAVVQCLMDCVVDASGKILAGPGYHDEDLVLLGMAAVEIGTRREPPARAPVVSPARAQFEREALGLPPGQRRLPPRPRPAGDRW